MRKFLSQGKGLEYLHAQFFLAELFIEQQSRRIEKSEREADEFEGSFQRLRGGERQLLTRFKRDQDPIYCTKNYQIVYRNWCLQEFRRVFAS